MGKDPIGLNGLGFGEEKAGKQQGLQGFQRGQGLVGFGDETKEKNQNLGNCSSAVKNNP